MEEDERPAGEPDKTPKQRLLQWIRRKLPDDVPVTNFTYDWNDGLALGGLVNSISPDSVSDWRNWEPDEALDNTRRAMTAAAQELGVAPLITPEELINPNVDEKSVMTYLAQFPQVKPPMRKGKLHGVEVTAIAGRAADFHVIMPTDEHKPKLSIQDEHGQDIHFTVNKIPATCNYNVKYTPEKVGTAKISLFTTSILSGESVASDSAEVRVIEGARMLDFGGSGKVGEVKTFEIENAGDGPVDVVVVDSDGKEHKLPVVGSTIPGCYIADYPLGMAGTHSVNAFHRGSAIVGSPFRLKVLPKSSWETWGRGLQSDGVCVGDKAPIYVQPSSSDSSDDINKAPISVEVVDGHSRKVAVTRTISNGRAKFEYTPTTEGVYRVQVLNAGEPIGQTPYEVSVSPTSKSPVRAFGPGLEGGIAQQPNLFYVNTHGDSDALAFTIEGPSKTAIECADRGQGQALVEYTPKESGVYKINILSKGEHIRDSPFVVWVDPANQSIRPSAVRVTGLETKKATKGEKTTFRIDTKNAGADLLPQVSVVDGKYGQIIPSMREVNPGLYECSFTPKDTGAHFVNIGVNGVAVPGAPFPLNVEEKIDASKLNIFGPGVEGPVVSQQPTHFTIDAKQAGPGAVEVALADRDGRAVDIDVLDNQDGSFTVKYTAPRPGAYQLNVVFAGVDGPPIEINVKPHVDRGGIRVEGLENADVLTGYLAKVKVDTGKTEAQTKGLQFIATLPNEKRVLIPCEKLNGKYEAQFIANDIGETKLELLFDEIPIEEAFLRVHQGQDASKCCANGPGLKKAIVGEKATFQIDTQGAGDGALALEISGPMEAETQVTDFQNGSCKVDYITKEPGAHQIAILYGEEKKHIPGSPFMAFADYKKDNSKIKVELPDNGKHRLGATSAIVVDASKTAAGEVTARFPPDQNQPSVVSLSSRRGVNVVEIDPHGKPGDIIPLEISYDGEPLKESPFLIHLVASCEPQKAHLEATRDGSVVSAGSDAYLQLNTNDCGQVKKVATAITGPDGHSRHCTIEEIGDRLHSIHFPTDLAGVYAVDALVNGEKISERPLRIHARPVGNVENARVKVRPIDDEWLLGEDKFLIIERDEDELEAHLSLLKSHPEALMAEIIQKRVDGKIQDHVRLRALEAGKQSVNVVYGGDLLPDGTVTFEAVTQLSRAVISPQTGKENIDQIELDRQSELQTEAQKREPFLSNSSEKYSFLSEQRALRGDLPPSPSKLASIRRASSTSNQGRDSAIEANERRYYGLSEQSPELKEREFNFNFDKAQINSDLLKAQVSTPMGMRDEAQIIDNHDGTVLVKYAPKTPGPHELTILHDGAILQGTPIKFFVDSFDSGHATVYGPGLQQAIVGESAQFTVSAKGSHAKELSVSIEGAAQANIKIHDNKDGTCSVSWIPPVVGDYKVHVKLGGRDVKDSPFHVQAHAKDGHKNAHLQLGSTSEKAGEFALPQIALNISESELSGVTATIKSPSGHVEPCFVRALEGGRLGVSFTPREAGEHLIKVFRDGKPIPKGPFKIKVDKSQIGDAAKVEVRGEGKHNAVTNQDNEILVDTSKAGYGGLSVSVQGPSKAELKCKEVKPGLIAVHYRPTEAGKYTVNIKFAEQHVKESPLSVVCTDRVSQTATEIERETTKPSIAAVGREANIYLKLSHTVENDMSARLVNPHGEEVPVSIHDTGDQYYALHFTPNDEGVHTLSVFHRDQHVNGSPFNFTVGHLADGGAHKVKASGMGVVRGEVGVPNAFNIYTREAGAGKLSVSVEGPAKAKMHFSDHKDGNCHAEYTVAEPGEYSVAVKFNDEHIAESPFKVFMVPSGEGHRHGLSSYRHSEHRVNGEAINGGIQYSGDADKVVAKGTGLNKFTPGVASSFNIDTGLAGTNLLMVGVVTSKGPCEEVVVKHMGAGHYVVNYKIHDSVRGFIFVKYGDREIPGSPFPIGPL
ncbi:unnamed protein product, partial [Mesorhabditis belari]|uniref:Calponin-homology (CH) domain-containing protein n=1 Tax=Mesorhabditis belari TaxID=2138241 RepID=A0AAF3FHR7_9BILA